LRWTPPASPPPGAAVVVVGGGDERLGAISGMMTAAPTTGDTRQISVGAAHACHCARTAQAKQLGFGLS
jgi:hypothetical protein